MGRACGLCCGWLAVSTAVQAATIRLPGILKEAFPLMQRHGRNCLESLQRSMSRCYLQRRGSASPGQPAGDRRACRRDPAPISRENDLAVYGIFLGGDMRPAVYFFGGCGGRWRIYRGAEGHGAPLEGKRESESDRCEALPECRTGSAPRERMDKS